MNFILPTRFPLLPRKRNTSKADYGHVLLVAGSLQYTGAAVLATRAACLSGAGLVTLASVKGLKPLLLKVLPEAMHLALPETSVGTLSLRSQDSLNTFLKKRAPQCLVIGPGVGIHTETARLVRRAVTSAPCPVVLDADGLNAFRGQARLLKHHKSNLVLTPHQGEFERLFGQTLPGPPMARTTLAKKLSKFYDVVLVLKGHGTLVVFRDTVYHNTTGNPGMAKGGSGDILSGVIAAFIAQGLSPFMAAAWAVFLHGKAGDMAVRKKSELGVLASDLLENLPRSFLTVTH